MGFSEGTEDAEAVTCHQTTRHYNVSPSLQLNQILSLGCPRLFPPLLSYSLTLSPNPGIATPVPSHLRFPDSFVLLLFPLFQSVVTEASLGSLLSGVLIPSQKFILLDHSFLPASCCLLLSSASERKSLSVQLLTAFFLMRGSSLALWYPSLPRSPYLRKP